MSNHKTYYRDNDFRQEHSANYTLLVQIGPLTFSYAVIGHNRLLALELEHDLDELTEVTGENNLLFATYKQCIIGLPQAGFTFVPVSLFRPDRVADFARFLDVKANEKVFSQPLDIENQVIYKVDENIATAIADKFDIKNTVFAAKGWILAMAANNPPNENLYVNIDNDKVELLNFKNDKLHFYNSFEFKNEDELVYFTSFVAEELQLQASNITLVLSGDVEAGDKNSNRLAEFFNKVELNGLKAVQLPEQISYHEVLTLTALSLCGSSAVY
jgi:hypothetical protein